MMKDYLIEVLDDYLDLRKCSVDEIIKSTLDLSLASRYLDGGDFCFKHTNISTLAQHCLERDVDDLDEPLRSMILSLLCEANILVQNVVKKQYENQQIIQDSCTSACQTQFDFCMDNHGSQSSCRLSLQVCLNRCRGIDGRDRAWFYEHINYEGSILLMPVGEYSTLSGRFNNKISSMRVKYGLTVACYREEHFRGKMYEFRGDFSDLRTHPIGNDAISSMIVFK